MYICFLHTHQNTKDITNIYVLKRRVAAFHISGLDSSGITVKVTRLSLALFTTAFMGTPTLSPIISIICHNKNIIMEIVSNKLN
jgi:hypothetical protein